MVATSGQGLTKSHVKRLLALIGTGASIFVLLLAAVQISLNLAGHTPDSTFYYFYPIMVALGAAFGFERWWGQEQEEYNPFHDR